MYIEKDRNQDKQQESQREHHDRRSKKTDKDKQSETGVKKNK